MRNWPILFFLGALAIVLSWISLSGLHAQPGRAFILNLATSLIGSVVTYLIFDRLIGLKEKERDKRTQLIRDLHGMDRELRDLALQEMIKHGWLVDADLRGVNLEGTALLRGKDLTRANLTRAKLFGADLSEAKLDGAILYDADLHGAILIGCSLEAANLAEADLRECFLERANLRACDLTRADLSGAKLKDANTDKAKIDGTKLAGADLTRTEIAHLLDI